MPQGTVKWWSDEKGYGFIERDGEPDAFVHFSRISQTNLERASGVRRNLEAGQAVEFTVEQGPKGPQAVDVRVVGDG